MASYDIAVIGAGPGGYVAALRAAQKGAQVVLIEKDALGGTCLNYGCIPTKTLFTTAQAYHAMQNAADFGLSCTPHALVWEDILARKNAVVAQLNKGISSLMKAYGVTVLKGTATLVSPTSLTVTDEDDASVVNAEKIIIATGSRPARPAAFPFDGEYVMDSTDMLARTTLPQSIIIVGGGYIGCEFASILHAFGVQVTVVEKMASVLPEADTDIQKAITRSFKKKKIAIKVGAGIDNVRVDDGMVSGDVEGETVCAHALLVAIGRTSNTEELGCEAAGVVLENGVIRVDEMMRTSVETVFAIGDVTGKIPLAHVASRQATVAVENACGGDEKMDYTCVPGAIFTLPEIGCVGMTEEQARSAYETVSVGMFPYAGLGRALAGNETEGFFKVIADAATDRIVGAHVLGAHATDIIGEAGVAIARGCTAQELGAIIHAHPTLSEGLMEAAHALHKACVHAPPSRR